MVNILQLLRGKFGIVFVRLFEYFIRLNFVSGKRLFNIIRTDDDFRIRMASLVSKWAPSYSWVVPVSVTTIKTEINLNK